MKSNVPISTRIWLLIVSLPVTYAILVLLMLPVRDWFKTLPELTFPIAYLLGLIVVDRLLSSYFGKAKLNGRSRILLFLLFLIALLISLALASSGPALQS